MPKPEIIRCQACGRRKSRSTSANARYWLLLHLIAEKLKPQEKSYSAETWHEYFKQRYLGADEVELPNGKLVQKPHSTTDLDVDAFNEYMAKVEQWGIEHEIWLEGDQI